jgi:K+-sensing histidine kinase KdpD
MVVAAALLPARGHTDNTNIALALVVVVVAVAMLGRWTAAALSALSAVVAFDLFHTKPYGSLTIRAHDDVVTALLLLVVGLAVSALATRSRHHHEAATEGSNEIARIHAVAELVASGEHPDLVVIAVAIELRDLLSLPDCRYQAAPFPADSPPLARVERSGHVTLGQVTWGVETMGLPGKQVELPVEGHGHTFGRYLLVPTPGLTVTFDRRVVAVAVADQVAAAFAAYSQREHHG